ncbi:MAG: hypothetical protein O3A95_11060, partial [Planctomycetota bacterium]|nr:hypothetical protein [Planctomycetota bacterium]
GRRFAPQLMLSVMPPGRMSIPTREEINVYDTLDERSACEHFLGKTLDEAEALFRENSLYYQDDLLWMGPVGFRYYVTAAIRYIRSDAATGDSDIVSCFAGLLESRLESEPDEIRPVAERLEFVCRYIIDQYHKFEVTPEIYGDICVRLVALRETFSRMLDQPKQR